MLLGQFKAYVGLSTAFYKFERLISDVDFVDASQVDKAIKWKK